MTVNDKRNSPYLDHVCTYYGITKNSIESLPLEIQTNLENILPRLARPVVSVKEFLVTENEPHDIIIKILGLGKITQNKFNSEKKYQRILGADISGQLELSIPHIENIKKGQEIHLSGVKQITKHDGFPQVRLIRSGSATILPFKTNQSNVATDLYTPNIINLTDFPYHYVTIEGIVTKKGILKSFYSNKHHNPNPSEKIYSLIITLHNKDTEMEVYLNKEVAVEINERLNINDAVIIENVKFRKSKEHLRCYSSNYSTFEHKSVKSVKPTKKVKKLLFQLESTSLEELRTNHEKIGKIVLYMTSIVKNETRNGKHYQTAISDGETNGILTLPEKQEQILNATVTSPGTYELEGIYHTKYNNYKVETERFKVINSEENLNAKYSNPLSVNQKNSLVCLTGQLIDVYEPQDFIHNNQKKDRTQRVRFSCSGVTMNLSALKQEDKEKLQTLELYKHYNIHFIRLNNHNGFYTMRFTPFTAFQEKN